MPSTSLSTIRPLYGFTDPAGGARNTSHQRLRKVASSMAIAVGGTDGRNIFIVDAVAGRWSTDEYIERLYDTAARWELRSIGGEANGLAGLFMDALTRDAKWNKRHLPLVSVTQPTHLQKDYRIRTILQPLIGHGRLFIRADLEALINQIAAFPLSPFKDLIDSVASLCRFIPPRPVAVAESAERAQLVAYLRAKGTNPSIIERIARGESLTTERPDGSFRHDFMHIRR